MHRATSLQFARIMDEYARWRAVPPRERSPAPAWWWGAAMEALDVQEPMLAEWCDDLGLPAHSCFAEGAGAILALFNGQTSRTSPHDFPRLSDVEDHDVRDLHPQPSDDSAFQP